jgi:glycerate kinase
MTAVALRGVPSTILVACDSFKGTIGAAEVVEAIALGLEDAGRPVDRCPVADGGEGTLEALAPALGLERVELEVSDPLGRPTRAAFGLGPERPAARTRAREPHRAALPPGAASGRLAVVESAAASGLSLLSEAERDPLAASTAGTGELIVAARRAGARTILLAVGGSATTDGGRGALAAIARAGGLGGARLVVLCDVRTPFEDAARIFAPQKGASPEQVRALQRRLQRFATRLARDPRGVPMSGAAGGLSGGLWAALGAELVAGAPFVLDALDFDRRLRAARAVITGEGCLDRQSLAGKAVSEIATRARQAGVPCHAIVARHELDRFGSRMLDLGVVLEAKTPAQLRGAGRRLAELL